MRAGPFFVAGILLSARVAFAAHDAERHSGNFLQRPTAYRFHADVVQAKEKGPGINRA
jgi:hypothetical protein